MNLVTIGLGANLGNRLAHLKEARNAFRDKYAVGDYWMQSPVYQSSPVDCYVNAPDFYNSVIAFHCETSPEDLLTICKELERSMGRILDVGDGRVNMPRPLDADILFYGELTLTSETLTIPHKELLKRRFVLKPLSDIVPNYMLPNDTVTINDHLEHLETDEPKLIMVQASW